MIVTIPTECGLLSSEASREPDLSLTRPGTNQNASQGIVERFSPVAFDPPWNDEPPDDGTRYVIAWSNPDTDRRMNGRGKKRMTRAEAETLAAELNEQYPKLKHWIVPA